MIYRSFPNPNPNISFIQYNMSNRKLYSIVFNYCIKPLSFSFGLNVKVHLFQIKQYDYCLQTSKTFYKKCRLMSTLLNISYCIRSNRHISPVVSNVYGFIKSDNAYCNTGSLGVISLYGVNLQRARTATLWLGSHFIKWDNIFNIIKISSKGLWIDQFMMTSSNGNIFRVTGHH